MQPDFITKADDKGWTPLHFAAASTSSKSVSIIEEITKCSPYSWELVDKKGRNFLHLAVSCNNKLVVKHILETYKMVEGLVNQQDNDGNTPLHLASLLNRQDENFPFFRVTSSMGLLCSDKRVNRRVMNKENLIAQDISRKRMPLTSVDYPYLSNPRSETLKKEMVIDSLLRQNVSSETAGKDIFNDSVLLRRRQIVSNTAQVNIVVITLVFTVAFAACFQLPGGYVSDDGELLGTAVLKEDQDFKLFVTFNSIAVMMSALVIFGHFLIPTIGEDRERLKGFILTSSVVGTYFAVMSLIVGYVSAMAAVDLVSPVMDAAMRFSLYVGVSLVFAFVSFGLKGTTNRFGKIVFERKHAKVHYD